MLRLPRYSRFFSMALLGFIFILVLDKPFFESTSPTEVADNVFISIQIDNGETKLCIDNQSEYYFRTGLPDFADIEVYNDGKWTPIVDKKISLLIALVVPPNITSYETPYWSNATNSLESGFYRVKFSEILIQTSISRESTLETVRDTFVSFTIP